MEIGFISLGLVLVVLKLHKAKSRNMEDERFPDYQHRIALTLTGIFSIVSGICFTIESIDALHGQVGAISEEKLWGVVGIIGGPIISMLGLAMFICGSFMAISYVKGWLNHIHNPKQVKL